MKDNKRNEPTLARHEAHAMGIPVILRDSAIETTCAGARDIVVPDAKGL